MIELDVLRREFEAVPEPDEASVRTARARLMEEIDRPAVAPAARRRPWLRLAAVAAVGGAVALAGLTLALPRDHELTGTEIAAAAYRALTPPRGIILHSVERFRAGPVGRPLEPTITERWVASGPRQLIHERSRSRDVRWEWETGPCGSIRYYGPVNLMTVDRTTYAEYIRQLADPASVYRAAYEGGNVHYRGETTFRGIPAHKLVVSYFVSDRDSRTRVVMTYIVRRDNFYPLQTVRRTKTVAIHTYSDFAEIPRNTETERLLHVAPRPRAYIVGRDPGGHRPACAGFGSYESLTGRKVP